MKKKNDKFVPKNILNALVDDISKFMQNNTGRLSILEIIEEIPWESRHEMLRLFSSYYNTEMVQFYHLIIQEYEKEFRHETERALKKYKMAGQEIVCPKFSEALFYKAFITRTRHTGKVGLKVISISDQGKFSIESFQLSFGHEGIYEYFITEDLSQEDYKKENFDNWEEISYKEFQYLLQETFNFNRKNMTQSARGKFLYKKYLSPGSSLQLCAIKDLIMKSSPNLTPRQVVNTFFNALGSRDVSYLRSMIWVNSDIEKQQDLVLLKLFKPVIRTGVFILEAKVNKLEGSNNYMEAQSHITTVFEGRVIKYDFLFILQKNNKKKWRITDIRKIKQTKLSDKSKLNPLNIQVNCRTYEINNIEQLFNSLDCLDNVFELGELPYGVHMRINKVDNRFNVGMSCLNDVVADMVINGEEFVIICQKKPDLEKINQLLMADSTGLISRGIYKLPLSSAYRYLSGYYNSFEDIFLEKDSVEIGNDNLRFITIRYLIKEEEPVNKFLEKLKPVSYEINPQDKVYYQLNNLGQRSFFAEYIVSDNWLTVSAFGDRDIAIARDKIEKSIFDYLQFSGMEIKEEGIFEILTSDVRLQYPDLERHLKEIYLNKWYYSKCAVLKGMSPSEAIKSEEGKKLIWEWFKLMKYHGEKSISNLQNGTVKLREYINKINL